MIKNILVSIVIVLLLGMSTTLAADKTKSIVEKNKVAESDFYYANNKRTTVMGDLPNLKTDINPWGAAAIGGVLGGIFWLQHEGQMKSIWKERGEFKIVEDDNYAFYVDKFGHFYGCYFASYIGSEALMTAGFSWDLSVILGGVIGLSYSTYIEILDGYAVSWGFSPSDFYADVAGASFFVAQHYVPFLQNFTPKYTYIPAPWHGENKRRPSEMFQDDYSSHTLWLSVNVHNILPDAYKDYWPEWMELSFGYAARNLCDNSHPELYKCDPCKQYVEMDGYYGSPRYIIGLDYNLAKLLPDGPSYWNWIKQSLMYIKFPAPAIEFGPTTRVYLLYPFHFQLNINI